MIVDQSLRSVVMLDEVSRGDVALVGGKGANLGELLQAGFPVPGGFVVTAAAYLEAMDAGGVRANLRELSGGAATGEDLAAGAAEMQRLVHEAGVTDALRGAILEAYRQLGPDVFVAVRSSATAEDSATTSFAGMNETYTNVRGLEELLVRIVDCWASLFAARVCSYRAAQGITDEPALAVVVQRMVDADRSGVMFSVDPTTGDRAHVVIEGAFGLGEVVVGGAVEPDTYVLAKDGPTLLTTRIGSKGFRVVRGADGHDRRVTNDAELAGRAVLSEAEAVELAAMGKRVEAHYGTPQDTEWAFEGDTLFLVQTRPITTLGAESSVPPPNDAAAPESILVSGLPASPGVVAGRVARAARAQRRRAARSG